MPEDFDYDVFLSHSSLDKPVVREIAHRLEKDGLKVWLDESVMKPGAHIVTRIGDGLKISRVLVLCMSTNALVSDWTQFESSVVLFQDPLNKRLRLIPMRLDDTRVEETLAGFVYIDWRAPVRDSAYPRLLAACRPTGETSPKSQPPPPPSRGAPGATPAPQTTPRPGVSGEGLSAGGNVRLRDATGQGVSGKTIQAGGDIELTNEGGEPHPKP